MPTELLQSTSWEQGPIQSTAREQGPVRLEQDQEGQEDQEDQQPPGHQHVLEDLEGLVPRLEVLMALQLLADLGVLVLLRLESGLLQLALQVSRVQSSSLAPVPPWVLASVHPWALASVLAWAPPWELAWALSGSRSVHKS